TPDRFRRRLLEDLALACEMACDGAAAECVGDAARVVETLQTIQRARAARPRPERPVTPGAKHAGESTRARIRALRALPGRRLPRGLPAAIAIVGYVVVTVPASFAAHHAI